MHTYYDEFSNRIVLDNGFNQRTLESNSDIMDRIDTRMIMSHVHRELQENIEIERSESLESMYSEELTNEISRHMAEIIRNSADSILQSIAGVQPMQDTAGEVFNMKFHYAGFERKKLDLRLPDKLFEME